MAEMYQVITPQKPAAILKGVGPKVAGKLSSIGIETVNDVLFHLPANYENLSVMNLADAENNEKVTVMGTVRTEHCCRLLQGREKPPDGFHGNRRHLCKGDIFQSALSER